MLWFFVRAALRSTLSNVLESCSRCGFQTHKANSRCGLTNVGYMILAISSDHELNVFFNLEPGWLLMLQSWLVRVTCHQTRTPRSFTFCNVYLFYCNVIILLVYLFYKCLILNFLGLYRPSLIPLNYPVCIILHIFIVLISSEFYY